MTEAELNEMTLKLFSADVLVDHRGEIFVAPDFRDNLRGGKDLIVERIDDFKWDGGTSW